MTRVSTGLLVLLLFTGPALNTHAESRLYTVTDLGTLGGTSSLAHALNNANQVVGWAQDAQGHQRAFVWENGHMSDLGALPGGTNSEATDINNRGDIVGHAERGESCGGNTYVTHAFLFDGLTMNDMNAASGCSSRAWGVNDRAYMVGWAYPPGDSTVRGYLLGDQHFVDMGTIAWGTGASVCWEVNSATQVVGTLFKWDQGSSWYPFFWQDANGNGTNDIGEFIDLLNLSTNGRNGSAYDINDRGQVVGGADVSTYAPLPWARHAFLVNPANGLWFSDTNFDNVNDLMVDLGTLGGTWSEAWDINEAGTIVGYSTLAGDTVTNAFIIESGVMTNLNDRIPSGSGWTLIEARAINDAGDICGYGTIGGRMHAFLLSTPLRIYETPAHESYQEAIVTNEFSEIETQQVATVDGIVLKWSTGWGVLDTASVYTVEYRGVAPTSEWAVVAPTNQWPISGTVWTNSLTSGVPARAFRIRAEAQ